MSETVIIMPLLEPNYKGIELCKTYFVSFVTWAKKDNSQKKKRACYTIIYFLFFPFISSVLLIITLTPLLLKTPEIQVTLHFLARKRSQQKNLLFIFCFLHFDQSICPVQRVTGKTLFWNFSSIFTVKMALLDSLHYYSQEKKCVVCCQLLLLFRTSVISYPPTCNSEVAQNAISVRCVYLCKVYEWS